MWYHNGSQCILRVPQFFAAKFIISGGSKGGGSQFHTFFWKFGQNRMLAPNPMGNLGSAHDQ